jgi:lysozyme
MAVNKATLDLIKRWEGCRLKAYKDGGGVWTIGYGTTAAAGLGIVPKEGMTITQAQADDLLARGVEKFAAKIRPMLRHEPTDNQFGAFVSLAYNIGPGAFAGSTVLRRYNAGDLEGVPDAFRMWNKDNGKVIQGLKNRREDEIRLFLTPASAVLPESSVGSKVSTDSTTSLWTWVLAVIKAIFGVKT